MSTDDSPSPALLAARERSRLAEEKLRQHLQAGGTTGSFKQTQPAEITQALPEQTYQRGDSGNMGSNNPSSGGPRFGGRYPHFTGSGADAVQLARAHAQGYNGQGSGPQGGQGYGGSSQYAPSRQPQYNDPGQYSGPGRDQYSQGSQQYNQGGQQYGDDEPAPPVRQYPRGGSLHPSAYGRMQGGDTDYSRDYPSERGQGDRSQQPAGPRSQPTQQQGSGGQGPFSASSQDAFPDNTDSEASDAESVRLALEHARLRSRELTTKEATANAPTTGTPATGGPTSGQGPVESSTDTTYYDEEISLAPSDSLRDSSIGDEEDSLAMALRHAREASRREADPTPSADQASTGIGKRRGAPTNYAAMQIYNAMPSSIVEKDPAAAKRAAEKVADENRLRATYIPSSQGFDHRANIERAANSQGFKGGYQAGRQIDLPSQRVLPAHITPPPMSPGQVYRSASEDSSRSEARAPETTPAGDPALPPTKQNVQAGNSQQAAAEGEAPGVLGRTMNTLGDTANWMLGRDQTAANDSLESGTTTTTQRTIDGNPPPRDAGQQAADDIASRTVYVDLAPQAWAKAKAYGRAGIENLGEVLQATGQAMTTKAAQIEAKPEDMEVAHDHLAIAGEQVASVLPGGSSNNSGSQAGSQAGSRAGSQATGPTTTKTQPQPQTGGRV